MKKNLMFAVLVISVLPSIGKCLKDTSKIKHCDYKKLFYDNGKIKEEGCLINNLREGEWKFYDFNHEIYYIIPYIHNIKTGPSRAFYITGELREISNYKNNCRVDTTITFKVNGDTIAKYVSVPVENNKSTVVWRKYYNKNAKSDGTIETKDGKKYIWLLGEMVDLTP